MTFKMSSLLLLSALVLVASAMKATPKKKTKLIKALPKAPPMKAKKPMKKATKKVQSDEDDDSEESDSDSEVEVVEPDQSGEQGE